MFVKIKGQIVNLDLIKKISDVTPYKMWRPDLEAGDYHWMKTIPGGPKGEVEELNKTTNGTKEEQSYVVVYAVNIHHYQYEDVTRVVIGTSRIEARKIIENLIKELNENNSKIKEITA